MQNKAGIGCRSLSGRKADECTVKRRICDSENRKTYVWVVEGNKVSRREVTVYSPTGEANLLISKGLEPGETVVTAGVYQLTEGEAIKVLM